MTHPTVSRLPRSAPRCFAGWRRAFWSWARKSEAGRVPWPTIRFTHHRGFWRFCCCSEVVSLIERTYVRTGFYFGRLLLVSCVGRINVVEELEAQSGEFQVLDPGREGRRAGGIGRRHFDRRQPAD